MVTETLSLIDEETPLPEGWRLVRLSEVCDVRDGTHDTPKYVPKGIPLVTSKNLKDGKIDFSNISYISNDDHESIKKRSLVEKGDVLYAMIGTIGNPVIVNIDIEFSIKNVALFKFANSPILPEFFYYLIQSSFITEQVNAFSQGGIQQFVSLSFLRNLKISLPPTIEEQRRIASVLDEQMKAVEQARLAVEEQLKAANLLPNAFLRVVFESDEAQNWQKRKLGEIAKTCSGSTPSRSNPDYYKGSICWVKTGELKDGLILETEEHISELALKESSVRLLPPETLLVAMYGQGQTRGRTGLLKKPATTNQACFAILPNESFDSYFLQYWFRHNYQRLRQETEGRGGNQPNLNGDVLNNQIVSLPSEVKEQTKFVEKFKEQIQAAETLKKSLTEKLEAVKKLPAALLRKAFAGEI